TDRTYGTPKGNRGFSKRSKIYLATVHPPDPDRSRRQPATRQRHAIGLARTHAATARPRHPVFGEVRWAARTRPAVHPLPARRTGNGWRRNPADAGRRIGRVAGRGIQEWASTIMPAPTVPFVDSSMRMKPPVRRLRA